MENLCELCGSQNIKLIEKEESLKVKYGSKETYLSVEVKCLDCDNIILTSKTSEYYKKAKERSIENAIFSILNILEKQHSFTTYERILDLKFGTMYDWKVKKSIPTRAEFVLLNIIVDNINSIIHSRLM